MKTHEMRRTFQVVLLATSLSAISANEIENEPKWTSLFNGKDLSGWDTFLSYVPESGAKEILGVNKDPEGVFSVVDGSIRISDKIWGALTSKEEFENYHLRFQFKWGEKKWPPREKAKRDSGVLYHCVGPHGAQSDHWMRSHETQVQEGDCGDYHSLDGARMDLAVASVELDGKPELQYKPGAAIIRGVKQRVVKLQDFEKPYGQWNTLEVIARGDSMTHIVNGEVVLHATHSRQMIDGKEAPLARGKIQIQSEGAEVFYRNIEIKLF
ncbi:MAG: 3-keto-disaccharide hydrolase [bacterium]